MKTNMGYEENIFLGNLIEKDCIYEFYGVIGNHFKIGNVIFLAVEDPDDGYRSYLDSVVLEQDSSEIRFIKNRFSRKPLARVKVLISGTGVSEEIYIVDADTNHIWLSIYTEDYDDYYPTFRFDYKVPETEAEYNREIENLSPEILNAEYWV